MERENKLGKVKDNGVARPKPRTKEELRESIRNDLNVLELVLGEKGVKKAFGEWFWIRLQNQLN